MNNRLLISTLFNCLITFLFGQEKLIGRYQGALSRDGSIQLISVDFHKGERVTYEIPEAGLFDVPVSNFELSGDTIKIRLYYGRFFLFLNESKNELTGISEKWNPKLRIHLKKVKSPKPKFITEEVSFTNNDISLSGMLYHPIDRPKDELTYVVLVHGSGDQDRYSPYYISLGHQLAERGIGVLLFDKRGTGQSTGDWMEATFHDLAGDAIKALLYLDGRMDLNINKTGLLGTSQGGWVSSIAANKTNLCDFLIFNVGPSVSLFDQDIHRVRYGMIQDGWNDTAIDSAVTYTNSYFNYALTKSKKSWSELESWTKVIKKKRWADYANLPEAKSDLNWWMANAYDPAKHLSSLQCPVLSIFGELDVLVPPNENEELMRKFLTKSDIDFEIKVIPGVGHDMKTYHGLNGDNWEWPHVYWEWRKEPNDFIKSIIEFLNEQ